MAAALLASCVSASAQTPGTVNIERYVSSIDGSEQPYSVYVPTPYDAASPHPVVFHLHGYGGRLFGSVSAFQKQWADARGWLLVGPDGRGSQNYDHIGEDDFFRVLEDLQGKYNVDLERLYVVGVSMGGHGSYRLAFRYPDLFAASAPVAGWTDYLEFYPHWYEQAYSPKLPGYVDPSRLPLLLTASSLYQAENSRDVKLHIAYGLQDTVNPPINAQRVVEALRSFGYSNFEEVAVTGGHGAGYDLNAIYAFFEGKTRVRNPKQMAYVTNRLRYGGAHWLRIKDLTVREAFARIAGTIEPGNAVKVTASNVRAFTVGLNADLVDMGSPVTVSVNGLVAYQGAAAAQIALYAQYDDMYRLTGYAAAAPPAAPLRKHGQQEGPINEALLSRFLVVYGTSGTAGQTAANLRDAQLFAAQWNGWTILRWSTEQVPAGRENDWYVPPYPFAVGAYASGAAVVTPISDAAALATDTSGANLILFGDDTSNSVIAALAPGAPVQLAGGGIAAGGRSYAGGNIGYAFICPRPDVPSRSMAVFKGYLGSLPEIISWGAFNVGKDFEQLPFQFPDYVIYDNTAARTGIVVATSEFDYLPECYLESGFFDADWKLDATPPRTALSFDGIPGSDPDTYLYGGRVTLQANDNPGGTGVSYTEYRVDGGPWRTYSAPFWVEDAGTHTVEYRSADAGSSFLYGPDPSTGRRVAVSSANNIEPARSVTFSIMYGSGPGGRGLRVTKSSFRLSWKDHEAGVRRDAWRFSARLPKEFLALGSDGAAAGRGPVFGDAPPFAGTAAGADVPDELTLDLGVARSGPILLNGHGRGRADAFGGRASLRLSGSTGRLKARIADADLREAIGLSPADHPDRVTLYMGASLSSGRTMAGDVTHAYSGLGGVGRGELLPHGHSYSSPVVLVTACSARGDNQDRYDLEMKGLWFPGGGAPWTLDGSASVSVTAGASFSEAIVSNSFRRGHGSFPQAVVYRAGSNGEGRVAGLSLAQGGGSFRLLLKDVPREALGLSGEGGDISATVAVRIEVPVQGGQTKVLSVRADLHRRDGESKRWTP